MPGSGTAIFSEAGDFAAAMRAEGGLAVVLTGAGRFAARLTQVALPHLNLAAGEERLSRLALVASPPGKVLISFPLDDESRMFWGGLELRAGEIATLGPGGQAHARTEGPCRWGSIRLAATDFGRFAVALLGAAPALPGLPKRWRGLPAARRQLRQVHAAAIRAAEHRPARLTDSEAARGLEQQIVEALVSCFSGANEQPGPAWQRSSALAARFEELLRSWGEESPPMTEIRAGLGVSSVALGACCRQQLGISPSRYLRLRRLQRIRQALLAGDGGANGLAGFARRHGIGDLRRFAAQYQAFFGESPSATLRRARAAEAPPPRRVRPGAPRGADTISYVLK